MSIVARMTTRYGIGDEPVHTLKKSFFCNEAVSDSIFGFGNVDVTSPRGDGQNIRNVNDWLNTYYYALSVIGRHGIIIYSAYCDLINTDFSPDVAQLSKEYTIGDFDAAGAAPNWGPRGSIFVAASQAIPATGHRGWLRYYGVARDHNDLPKNFSASDISTDFAQYHNALGRFGLQTQLENKLVGYAVATKALAPGTTWTAQNGPSSSMHFGVING